MKIAEYIRHNLAVIPIRPRAKAPYQNNWPKRTHLDSDPNEFRPDDNVGVVLGDASNGLVDIDLDTEAAKPFAKTLLPQTGWIFGRPSNERSHYLYRTQGPGKTRRFSTTSHGTIIEYRANGSQTMLPPSIHPEGETVRWEEFGDCGATSRDDLVLSVKLIATGVIINPLYRHGQRNAVVLHLTGTLVKAGVPDAMILTFIDTLCTLNGDDERDQRRVTAQRTIDKHRWGEAISSLHALKDQIGDDFQTLMSWWGLGSHGSGHDHQLPNGPHRPSGQLWADIERNDSGIAQRFSATCKDQVVFDTSSHKFFVCKDGIWREDPKAVEVKGLFDEYVVAQITAVRQDHKIDHDSCKKQCDFLLRYRGNSNAEAAIERLKVFNNIDLLAQDRDRDVVACLNGLVDMRSGQMTPIRPDHYVTKCLDIAYDPEADCPHFKQLIHDCCCGDELLKRYLQGILGYMLTNKTDRQEFYIFHGGGNNGKSTLVEAIRAVLGQYAGTLASETVFEGGRSSVDYDLASVVGRRMVVAYEAESNFRLNAARLKQMTGGDELKVRLPYGQPFAFTPHFKIVIVCNPEPMLNAYDGALKRRIKLIPFDYVVPADKKDPKLGEKLKREAPGILNWLLDGARMYFNGEIVEPEKVNNATNRYIERQDTIKMFAEDRLAPCVSGSIPKDELYDDYKRYCNSDGIPEVSKPEFTKQLRKIGVQDGRNSGVRYWKGIQFKDEATAMKQEEPLSLEDLIEGVAKTIPVLFAHE